MGTIGSEREEESLIFEENDHIAVLGFGVGEAFDFGDVGGVHLQALEGVGVLFLFELGHGLNYQYII